MNRNLILGLVALIGGALGAGYYILQRGSSGDATQAVAENGVAQEAASEDFRFSWSEFPEFQEVLQPDNREAFLTPHWTDTAFGDPAAPVTIIEFFSYACPHCKSFHEGTYQRVLADYVDTGQVQFIKRDFLLNSQAVGLELLAGAGAQCLREDAQKHAFADTVFAQQRNLARAGDPAEALVPAFEAAGLEAGQARACMADPKNRSLVFGRSARAGTERWVTGTPTIFIDGERYAGNSGDYAALSTAIELAIASAN